MNEPQPQGSIEEAAARLMTPPPEETTEEVKEEAVSESSSETTIEEPETENTNEVSSDDEVKATDEVEETEEVTEEQTEESATADELAELNEWLAQSSDRYGDLVIPTKINGEEGKVKLADIVKDYQIYQSAEQRAEKTKAERAEAEQEASQLRQTWSQRLEEADQLSQYAANFFTQQFENIDWEDLRETDPAEYSARRQEKADVEQGLQSFRMNIAQQRQVHMNEQFNNLVQEQSTRLLETIPEWKDEQIASKEKSEIRDYLLSSGLSPQEVDGQRDQNGNIVRTGITDHRLIAVARKAMMYDRGQQKVEIAKKRVSKVPKMVKPGKPESVESISKAQDKAKRDRLRKSGKLEDAAALLMDSINI